MENVLPLKRPAKPKENEKAEETPSSLEEVQKRNEENKKRLEEDRKKANRGVIRSYRLKH